MLQKLHQCLYEILQEVSENGSTGKKTYAHAELCLFGLGTCVLAHIMTISDNADFLDKYVNYHTN